jgi:hypothetical protein
MAQALSKTFYRFTPSDDDVVDYFDEKGESATKFLMKTPINGARISSSFGKRKHPISRLHQAAQGHRLRRADRHPGLRRRQRHGRARQPLWRLWQLT